MGAMMATRRFHNIPSAAAHVAPYSHAVEVDGWVHITGQIPNDPADDGMPLPQGIGPQTRRTMDNLIIILNGLDLSLGHVVQIRVYLTHFERDYEAMNALYKNYFPDERYPARTCVGVAHLARDALIEIDAVARRPALGSADR